MDPGASDSSTPLALLVSSNGGPVATGCNHRLEIYVSDLLSFAFSSLPSSSKGHQESRVGSVNHDFDRTEVACTTVVSRSPGTLASLGPKSRVQLRGGIPRANPQVWDLHAWLLCRIAAGTRHFRPGCLPGGRCPKTWHAERIRGQVGSLAFLVQ